MMPRKYTYPRYKVCGVLETTSILGSDFIGISVASYNVGCFFGAISTIWLGNMLGRRKTIFLGSSIMVIGATLQCAAFGLPQFIVGRLVTGYVACSYDLQNMVVDFLKRHARLTVNVSFGNGLNTSTVPTWQSECSKSHRRGQLVMVEVGSILEPDVQLYANNYQGALITGGVCLSYWLDFGFSFLEPSTIAWRFPIAFQIFFAAVILAFILELPESPRWLILKGKIRPDGGNQLMVVLQVRRMKLSQYCQHLAISRLMTNAFDPNSPL